MGALHRDRRVTLRRALAVAAGLLALSPPAFANQSSRATVVVLPYPEAEALVRHAGAGVALGVNPGDRDGTAFVTQIGAGLRGTLAARGIAMAVGASDAAPPALRRAIEDGFGGPTTNVGDAMRSSMSAVAVSNAAEAAAALQSFDGVALVIGVAGRTPALVALMGRKGILVTGDRPRPGIVVPADLRTTLLHAVGIRVSNDRLVRVEARKTTPGELAEWTREFERDQSTRYELSVAFSAALYGPLAIAAIARRAGRSAAACRLAQATACSTAGYVGALFLHEGRAWIRALPVVAASAMGAAVDPSRGRRVAAVALGGGAAALAVGAILAPLRPTAEPAATLWGPPLEINRLFGLVNHLVALILVGVVGAWALGRLSRATLIIGCVAAAAVGGTAAVGANFVSVSFISAAAVVAVMVHRSGRLGMSALAAGGVASAVAVTLSLSLAPLGPSSHGSAAAMRIRDGGVPAIVDLVRDRIDENLDELSKQAAWFTPFVIALLLALVAAVVRALRAPPREPRDRHRYAGAVSLVVAAIVALVGEDTGVLLAPLIAPIAAAIWLIDPVERSTAAGRGAQPVG